MKARVRFAPSPTGHLHVGGARTALFNFLYARSIQGTYVLRVEDTDLERSTKDYEKEQQDDLRWLGLDWDEGPDKGGDFGPYRQSERLKIYQEKSQSLLDQKKAYHCFCHEDDLKRKKEEALAQGLDPHYDGTCRNLSESEVSKRSKQGEESVIRLKVNQKNYILKDLLRGEVNFPPNMVGDFVIMRSNGLPVYNFCCVVDDILMQITHVIRGDDHLSNTVRQLMVYEALEAKLPDFAHVSLLVGEDRQKLSKRHGATSVKNYRENGFLPKAMVNYLALLGWSHPEEKDIFDLQEAVDKFDLKRFSKSPAVFDQEKLLYINSQHLRELDSDSLIKMASEHLPESSPFHAQSDEWKESSLNLLKNQISLVSELPEHLENIFEVNNQEIDSDGKEIWEADSTQTMAQYLKEGLEKIEGDFVSIDQVNDWMSELKKEYKIKGKPLFMGLRLLLTGRSHGPDLKILISLTPKKNLIERVNLK